MYPKTLYHGVMVSGANQVNRDRTSSGLSRMLDILYWTRLLDGEVGAKRGTYLEILGGRQGTDE